MNKLYINYKSWLKYLMLFLFGCFLTIQVSAAVGTYFNQASNKNNTQGTVNWIGSIVQQSNSRYYEGQTVLQRLYLEDLPRTANHQHTLRIMHQSSKGGIHAYDFITNWPAGITSSNAIAANTLSIVDGCSQPGSPMSAAECAAFTGPVTNATAVASSAYGSHGGDNVASRVAAWDAVNGTTGRQIQMWATGGGAALTISSATLTFIGYTLDGFGDSYAEYDLTWTMPSNEPALCNYKIHFAGHIAVGGDGTGIGYGPGKGASSISGGPYHFKLGQVDGISLGAQDNQLKGADILIPPPSCPALTGPNLCPNKVGTYSITPVAGETYLWSIDGGSSGAFFDPSNQSLTGSSVTVNAGPGGSGETIFTLQVAVTNSGGTISCPTLFKVSSNTKPVITVTGCTSLKCNPTQAEIDAAFGTATAKDNSGADITAKIVTKTSDPVSAGGCMMSQTRTWDVMDACDIAAKQESCTVTWKVDTEAPVITADNKDSDLKCNPTAAAIEAALGSAKVTDQCDDVKVSSKDGEVLVNGCYRSQTRTFSAVDECGNTATEVTVTVKWKEDITGPYQTTPLTDLTFACGEPVVIPQPSYSDNCGTVASVIAKINGNVVDLSTYVFPVGTTTVCFTATDECGNPTTDCIRVTVQPCSWNCDTAFGKATSDSFCFLNDPTVPNNRWGWTNSIKSGTTTLTLYAGASGCNVSDDKIAGTVTVVYAWPNVTVTYNTMNGYVMSEAHLYVGSSKYPMKGNKVTVAPGQYPYSAGSLNNATTYTFNITFKGNQPSTMYVIAHAVTCKQAASTTTLVAPKGAPITTGLEARSLKAYPNPFSEKVMFEFVSDKDTHAVLEITNIVGQKIKTLLNASVKAGVMNRIEYSPQNVTPGILIYQLITDDGVQSGRLIYKK